MATRHPKRGRNGQFAAGGVRVRGFIRVNLVEHEDDSGAPRVVGDSGWVENVIVSAGKNQYLAMALAGSAGSKSVARMAIGAGTDPATSATSLESEFADMAGASSTRNRATVLASTGGANTATVQFAATWASAVQFVTTTHVLKNIGLYHNTDNAGTIFAGVSFATSALNTNQDVQASYVISFV